MAYLGKTPSQATRRRYYKTASGSETSLSGTMTTGGTLTFSDGEFVDVSVNGVALVAGTDYNTTTANTIGGLSALSANDQVEIIVYDTFSVFGGNVNGDFTVSNGTLSASGNVSFDGGSIKLDGNFPTGTGNVALGNQALDDGSLSGNNNTAVGSDALSANTSGVENTAVGMQSLDANTTGESNTGMGVNTLTSNSTGSNNTAVGRDALQNNTTADNNVAVGRSALTANTTAGSSVAIGHSAGYSQTTNGQNVFVGTSAGYYTDGYKNCYVGFNAGDAMTTGDNNTILGSFSGNENSLDIRTSNNYIVLSDGDGNPRQVVDGSGRVAFGTVTPSTSATATINAINSTTGALSLTGPSTAGYYTVLVDQPSGNSYGFLFRHGGTGVGSIGINSSSTSYNTSSDHRLKENVADMTGAIDRVKALAPKRFNFIVDADTTVDGFLAHEAQAVVPEAVTGTKDEVDDDGKAVMQGIDQSKLVPLLTGALREAIAKIETLETKVAALEAK